MWHHITGVLASDPVVINKNKKRVELTLIAGGHELYKQIYAKLFPGKAVSNWGTLRVVCWRDFEILEGMVAGDTFHGKGSLHVYSGTIKHPNKDDIVRNEDGSPLMIKKMDFVANQVFAVKKANKPQHDFAI